jgi:hypothetical protein
LVNAHAPHQSFTICAQIAITPQARDTVMFANLKIRQRLVFAVALPMLLLVGLACYDLAEKWNTRAEMAMLTPLARGVADISCLVHE